MRLKKHLTELYDLETAMGRAKVQQKEPVNLLFDEQVWPTLERDCKKYIKEIAPIFRNDPTSNFLYRGAQVGDKHSMYKQTSHVKTGRKSKLMDTAGHAVMNIAFKKVLGWPVRNGVLTISKDRHAKMFGNVWLFFPIGDYKYAYNPDIQDLNYAFDNNTFLNATYRDKIMKWEDWWYHYNRDNKLTFSDDHDDHDEEYFRKNPDQAQQIIGAFKLLDFARTYKEDDLKLAIDKKVEVSFNCDSYYLVNYYNDYEERIKNKLRKL
jgi:hypothetical protein